MKKPRHFGTDGLRGVANVGLLAPERVLALGRALGRLAVRRGGGLVLGRDPRRSSPLIAGALAAGAAAEGCDVVDLGVLPTPGIAALVAEQDAALGVVVSASHNPMEDNGIKVLRGDGGKLPDADEAWLESEMNEPAGAPPPTGAAIGAIRVDEAALERYVRHLLGHFPELRLDGMRLVVDAANGATAVVAPLVFERLGAEVTAIHASPDGVNINRDCGAVHPESLARAVVAARADLGMAFDGDGDRAILAGADGSLQDGDRILYVCATRLQDRGALADGVVVGTVMTNYGLELAFEERGIRLERTPVGDRFIAHALRENGWSLGGEPSGHVIFGPENRYIGDGIYTALAVLTAVRAAGRPLHELSAGLRPVPQVLLNVRVASKPALDQIPGLQDGLAAAEARLAGAGRLLVRYSGTENLCRVMVEGRDADVVERTARELAVAVRDAIGEDAAVPP